MPREEYLSTSGATSAVMKLVTPLSFMERTRDLRNWRTRLSCSKVDRTEVMESMARRLAPASSTALSMASSSFWPSSTDRPVSGWAIPSSR